MSNNAWLLTAKKNLIPKSINDIFKEALKEWKYNGIQDKGNANFKCELCEHLGIRYEYEIVNNNTKKSMVVGSSCINKFIDYSDDDLLDINGNTVTSKSIENDKKNYLLNILVDLMHKKFYGNEFQCDITNKVANKENLSINQAKYLRSFYNNLNNDEKKIFMQNVSLDMRTNLHKKQYLYLKSTELPFIDKLLTTKQKNTLKRVYNIDIR